MYLPFSLTGGLLSNRRENTQSRGPICACARLDIREPPLAEAPAAVTGDPREDRAPAA